MGWEHIEGDIDVPYLTERESFRDVLLTGRLRDAIKKINLDDGGKPWLDDDRVNEVVSRLERITAPKLLEAKRRHLISSCRALRWQGTMAILSLHKAKRPMRASALIGIDPHLLMRIDPLKSCSGFDPSLIFFNAHRN